MRNVIFVSSDKVKVPGTTPEVMPNVAPDEGAGSRRAVVNTGRRGG
jgi:hypothetical protein